MNYSKVNARSLLSWTKHIVTRVSQISSVHAIRAIWSRRDFPEAKECTSCLRKADRYNQQRGLGIQSSFNHTFVVWRLAGSVATNDIRLHLQNIIGDICVALDNALSINKTFVYWDKPTNLGFCILELSKLHMYEFHYDYMMQRYGHKRAWLLFTDRYSLTYAITTDNIYDDMLKDERLSDTSDYPHGHKNSPIVNAKVVGKFKNECGSLKPLEFVSLWSKMYS